MTVRPTAMDALAANPAASALIMDFDGVLAPIVEDPAASGMPADVASVLARLVPHLLLVAVVSGRPLAFLQERVPVAGIRLLGSYGIERMRDGEPHVAASARDWSPRVRDAGRQLKAHFAGWHGIRVEEKAVSVAVHWRQAPDQDAAADEVRNVTASIADSTGLRLEPGKMVEELRPEIDVDKGSAIASLLRETRPTVAVYGGDDLGDLSAMEAVRAAGGYAIVVDHGDETDDRLIEVADEVIHGTVEFAAWLTTLAGAIGA